ncbi:MAG: hypothetical protein LBO79_09530, partial [Zoogloeaceae bacterium]|nr:hypothetical protein [Zoogloeaceae bacterium]
ATIDSLITTHANGGNVIHENPDNDTQDSDDDEADVPDGESSLPPGDETGDNTPEGGDDALPDSEALQDEADNEPEGGQPEDNQPEDSQPEDSQPEDSQPEDSQPADNQPEDNQPEDSHNGNDTYLFNRGDGQGTIEDYDETAGNLDTLSFGADISADQLWFRKTGEHLEISLIGTADTMTIHHWYSSAAYRVEQFQTQDGATLTETGVQALVDAMAAFTPPDIGTTELPDDYNELLQIVGINWTEPDFSII